MAPSGDEGMPVRTEPDEIVDDTPDDVPSTDDEAGDTHSLEDPATASAAAHYELLSSCDKELPVNRIVRELTFGRFIALADTVDVPTSARRTYSAALTLPLNIISAAVAAETRQPEPPSVLDVAEAAIAEMARTNEDAAGGELRPPAGHAQGEAATTTGGGGGGDATTASPDAAGEAVEVKLQSISDFVAERRVNLGSSEPTGEHQVVEAREVILTPEIIAKLVTEGKAEALLRDDFRVVRLDGTQADDAPKTVLSEQHVIPNVPAFLSRPQIFTNSGRGIDLSLESNQVNDLLQNRAVKVIVEGQELTLEPNPTAGSIGGGETVATSYAERAESRAMDELMWTTAVSRPVVKRSAATALVETPSTWPSLTVVPFIFTPTVIVPTPEERPEAPQVGFFIPYRQTWTLLGYSRGALLNTIALAPQEETQIELFTWDRRTNALEQTSASEVEQAIESTDMTKDVTQVLTELGHDSNFKAEANFDVSAKLEVVNIGGGEKAGGGTSARDVARTTTDFIHEKTTKASMRVKASRQSKVSETHESGSEERTTRKIKNANMCDPLHLDYFEVLVNYEMETTCLRQEAQLVVMLNPPETYDWWSRKTIRRFEPVLRASLLDRAFIGGFDASRLLAARECAFETVCERSICDDEVGEGAVSEGEELDDLRAAAVRVIEIFKWFIAQDWTNNYWVWAAFYNAAPPDGINIYLDPTGQVPVRFHQWLFLRHLRNKGPTVWSGLTQLAATFPTDAAQITPRMLRTLHLLLTPKGPSSDLSGLLTLDQQARGELKGSLRQFALQIYKDIKDAKALGNLADFAKFAIALVDPFGAIAAAITGLVAQAAQRGLVELAAEIGIAAVDALYGTSDLDDQGLVIASVVFNDAYDAWQKANADLLRRAADTAEALDTLANQRDDQIRSAFTLSTVAEACEREEALMMHLSDNDSYYSFAVYQSRIASESALLPMLVSASDGLIAPNAIGTVNGKLAFPVNFDAVGTNPEVAATLETWFNSEIRENTELDEGPEPSDVSMPTPGITLRTRFGTCSGCDGFIRKQRKLDVELKKAEVSAARHRAKQAKHEARRFRLRLEASDLDDPTPGEDSSALRVVIKQEKDEA